MVKKKKKAAKKSLKKKSARREEETTSVDEAFERDNFEEYEITSSNDDFEDGQLDLF